MSFFFKILNCTTVDLYVMQLFLRLNGQLSANFVVYFRCEAYDYIFEVAVKMKSNGLDPMKIPSK